MRKSNNVVYFFSFLIQGIILGSFLTYLSIRYFLGLIGIEYLILFQTYDFQKNFTLSILLIILALISDIYNKTLFKRRNLLITGSLGIIISLTLMVVSNQIIVLYLVFWYALDFSVVIMIVGVVGSIIDTTSTFQERRTPIFLILVGNSIGLFLGLYLPELFSVASSFLSWLVYLIIQIIILFPILLFCYFLFEHRNKMNYNNQVTISNNSNRTYTIYIVLIAMLVIFYTLQAYFFGFKFSWIPFTEFSPEVRELFLMINYFYYAYYILGITLRYTLLRKVPIKTLFYYLIPTLTAFSFSLLSNNPYIYIILAVVIPVLSGIIIMALTNIMMSFSHDKFSVKYQVLVGIASFSSLMFSLCIHPILYEEITFIIGLIITSIMVIFSVFLLHYIELNKEAN